MNETQQPTLEEQVLEQTETAEVVHVIDTQTVVPQVMTQQRLGEVALFEHQQRVARLFVASGMFADVKNCTEQQAIAKAVVKIALGDAMGFTPAESMQGIDIIQGRPAIGASLRAARMQRAGFSWRILKHDESGCWLKVIGLNGEELGEVSFTKADAERNGLLGKDNWKKNPLNMYYARAISNAQRFYAPGALGAVGMDLPSREEAMDMEPAPPQLQAPRRKS